MKEGWEYKKLGDVANFISGYTPNKEEISNQGKYPYFKVAEMNIAGNELFMRNTSLFVNSPKRIYPKGSIIFPKNGGAIYTEKKRILEVDSVIDLNTEAIFPTAQVELMYLFFLLTFTKISSFDKGGGLPSLDIKKMSESIIPVPPLSEQQSIVDYLDSAFAKIDAMKANAEKALNEAKALFQASLKEMLEPKEGWEEKKLGEVGTFIRGGNFSKKDFVEGGFPCIHYGQIHTKLGVATYKHLSCVPASMVKKDRCASRGDLVIAVTSEDDEGSCKCTAWMADYDAYVGGHTAILKHSLNPIFVSYYFKAARFQKAKLEYTHGFKVVEISPKDIAKIPIAYPSPSEQQSIVATLDSLKSKVDRLQENCDKISQECDALKQAILRQVFE